MAELPEVVAGSAANLPTPAVSAPAADGPPSGAVTTATATRTPTASLLLAPFAPASDPLARVPLFPEEAVAPPTRVAVTGATGFVAGNVVARLLAAGHTVHATVRDPDNEAALAPLKALPGAAERLVIFKADLLTEGSFDAAVSGCTYVLHTASPFIVKVGRGEARAKLIDPAVKGVEHVLAAVERSPSVKRVVLTSSIAAMMLSTPEKAKPGLHRYDENDWNTTSSEAVLPYPYSKTLAEKRAWELCEKQSRWSLVTLCPGLVLGPPLSSRTDSESIALVSRMMRGEMWPAAPYAGISTIDVRDLAAAHTLAAVHPKAQGRYGLSGSNTTLHEFAALVAGLYPGGSFWPPLCFVPKWLVWLVAPLAGLPREVIQYSFGYRNIIETAKVRRELGFKFTDPALTMRDMIEDLAARKIIKHPKPSVAAVAPAP